MSQIYIDSVTYVLLREIEIIEKLDDNDVFRKLSFPKIDDLTSEDWEYYVSITVLKKWDELSWAARLAVYMMVLKARGYNV